MKDSLLLIVFLMVCFFGYHEMDRLDRFLAEGHWQQSPKPQVQPVTESLRLGFLDPMPAKRITGILEGLARRDPDIALHLTSGTADELMEGFSKDRYDAIFTLEGDEDIFILEGDEDIAKGSRLQPAGEQTVGGKRQWKVV